ncbi:MAG: choice-of-anchor D domain-containing protein [Planctomycetes bacterium]|nr:choice-of-anchor D domain-containing protein [Planctomycetota bacterium]
MRSTACLLLVLLCAALPAQDLVVREGSPTGAQITDGQAVGGLRDYGQVPTSTNSYPLNIYFTNNRATDINFGTIAKVGADPADFYLDDTAFQYALPPGQTCVLTITFYRTTVGTCTAMINVPHDAAGSGASPFEVNLRAEAVPRLRVTLGSPTGPLISHNDPAAGTPRDFGSQDVVAGPTASIQIWVTNIGSSVLNLSTPDMGGTWWNQFVVNATGMSSALAQGQSTSFQVSFDPTTIGSMSAYARLAHTSTDSPSPYYVPVLGVGVAGSPVPVMELRHGTTVVPHVSYLPLGTYWVDTPFATVFTIHNKGTGDLTLTSTPLVGIQAATACTAFVSAAPSTTVIPPAGQTAFTVNVTPLVHGNWSYEIYIGNDDPARNPYFVTIQGIGLVSPTELRVTTHPASTFQGAILAPAPVLAVTDANGNHFPDDYSTQVQVLVLPATGTSGAVLTGTLVATMYGGYVTFTDLRIDRPGTGYQLAFVDLSGSLSFGLSDPFDIVSTGGGGSGGNKDEEDDGCSMPASRTSFAALALLLPALFRRRTKRA